MLRALAVTVCSAATIGFVWYAAQAAEHARVRGAAHARLATLRQARIETLEAELASVLVARDGIRAFVSERAATEAADRDARQMRLQAATKSMPEGLRLAVETLHELLRRNGHARLRVLALQAIENKELRGLELFEAQDRVGSGNTLWQAARVTVRLERSTGTLTLTLHDGWVVRDGIKSDLPGAGEPLVLLGVDGRAFEARLPFLIEADGDYPQAVPRVPPAAKLDPFTVQNWLARLNEVLAHSTASVRWRVTQIEGLADGEFLGVVMLGAVGKRVEQMAEVDRMAIVVDDAAGTVEVEMIGGVLRRTVGETTLPASAPGQRILLTGVTPQAASHALTGMVLRR